MRSHEVFARMTPDRAATLLGDLKKVAPGAAAIALGAAAQAFKLRPQFLRGQPRARQAEWVRKALSRPTLAAASEEVLAEYFLSGRKPLLIELCDALGVEHEEGALKQAEPACPAAGELEQAVAKFRSGDEPDVRELLLAAFAAQSAIDWPRLDELVPNVLGVTLS